MANFQTGQDAQSYNQCIFHLLFQTAQEIAKLQSFSLLEQKKLDEERRKLELEKQEKLRIREEKKYILF